MENSWHNVVDAALREGIRIAGGRAISGARLRQLIVQYAKINGLDFPPPQYNSFSKFIETFSDLLLIQRREGRDFLVVPANMPELFTTEAIDSNSSRVRDDLFRALTQIRNKNKNGAEQYYLSDSDELVWIEKDQPKPSDAVPFPQASLEQEIFDRRTFAELPTSPLSQSARDLLLDALNSSSPLGSFTSVVRDQGLHQHWHRYRMSAVLQRLRSWCKQNNVTWSTTWIVEDKPLPNETLPLITTDLLNKAVKFSGSDFFTLLADVVTTDDLARIQVPLDLVMKVWHAKHR
jgi:hypothetical protein